MDDARNNKTSIVATTTSQRNEKSPTIFGWEMGDYTKKQDPKLKKIGLGKTNTAMILVCTGKFSCSSGDGRKEKWEFKNSSPAIRSSELSSIVLPDISQ